MEPSLEMLRSPRNLPVFSSLVSLASISTCIWTPRRTFCWAMVAVWYLVMRGGVGASEASPAAPFSGSDSHPHRTSVNTQDAKIPDRQRNLNHLNQNGSTKSSVPAFLAWTTLIY